MFLEALHASIGIAGKKVPSAVTIPRFGILETGLSSCGAIRLPQAFDMLQIIAKIGYLFFLPYFCHSYLIWSILFGSSPLVRSSSFKSPHF